MLRTLTRKALALGFGFGVALWSGSAQAVPTAIAPLADVNAAIGGATTTTDTSDNDIPAARLVILDLGATSEVGGDDRGSRFLDDPVASRNDVDGVDVDDTAAPPTLTEVFPLPVIGILLAGLGLLAVRRRSRARVRMRSGMAPPSQPDKQPCSAH